MLQIAGLARSTYCYRCQPNVRAEQQSDMQCRIRAVYDKHKGRPSGLKQPWFIQKTPADAYKAGVMLAEFGHG